MLAQARSTSRSSLLRHIGSFFSVSVVAAGMAFLANTVVGRMLGPEQFGIFYACMLIVAWGKQVHLGLYNAFAKQYPVELGKGDEERAHAIGDSTFWASLTASVVVVIGVIGFALLYPDLEVEYRLGMVVIGIQLIAEVAYQFTFLHQRVEMRFKLVNWFLAIRRFSDVALKIALTWLFGLYGLFAASLASVALTVALTWVVPGAARFGRHFQWKVVKEMLVLGFPIFAVTMVGVVFTSIGRPLVLVLYSAKILGYFGMGQTFANMMRLIPQSAQIVLGPTMMMEYGRTGEIQVLARYVRHPTRILALGILGVIVVGTVVLEAAIVWVLPEFGPGIVIGKILFFDVYFRSVTALFGYFLITLDDRRPMFVAQVAALFLTAAVASVGFVLPMKGVEVALALALGNGAYAVWMVAYVHRRYLKTGDHLRYQAELLLPLAATGVILAGLTVWVPLLGESMTQDSLRSLFHLGVGSLPLVAWAAWVQRRSNLISDVRAMLGRRASAKAAEE